MGTPLPPPGIHHALGNVGMGRNTIPETGMRHPRNPSRMLREEIVEQMAYIPEQEEQFVLPIPEFEVIA